MLIMHNSKLITEAEATFPLLSDAVMYGAGFFETMRSRPGKKILFPEKHINRLLESLNSAGIRIPLDAKTLLNDLERLLHHSKNEFQQLKIFASEGEVFLISKDWTKPYDIKNGIKLKAVKSHRSLPGWKSSSYFDCLIAWKQAQKEGFYDALFVDNDLNILENSRSNIFWIQNGQIHSRQKDVLPGITRDFIMNQNKYPVSWSICSMKDLESCDEIFLSNALVGIVPVRHIQWGNKMISKPAGGITQALSNLLESQ